MGHSEHLGSFTTEHQHEKRQVPVFSAIPFPGLFRGSSSKMVPSLFAGLTGLGFFVPETGQAPVSQLFPSCKHRPTFSKRRLTRRGRKVRTSEPTGGLPRAALRALRADRSSSGRMVPRKRVWQEALLKMWCQVLRGPPLSPPERRFSFWFPGTNSKRDETATGISGFTGLRSPLGVPIFDPQPIFKHQKTPR